MNAVANNNLPWTREEFEEKLRTKGQGYHIYHPIHVAMAESASGRTSSSEPSIVKSA